MMVWGLGGQGAEYARPRKSRRMASDGIRILSWVAAATLFVLLAGPLVWPLVLVACVFCLGLT